VSIATVATAEAVEIAVRNVLGSVVDLVARSSRRLPSCGRRVITTTVARACLSHQVRRWRCDARRVVILGELSASSGRGFLREPEPDDFVPIAPIPISSQSVRGRACSSARAKVRAGQKRFAIGARGLFVFCGSGCSGNSILFRSSTTARPIHPGSHRQQSMGSETLWSSCPALPRVLTA